MTNRFYTLSAAVAAAVVGNTQSAVALVGVDIRTSVGLESVVEEVAVGQCMSVAVEVEEV